MHHGTLSPLDLVHSDVCGAITGNHGGMSFPLVLRSLPTGQVTCGRSSEPGVEPTEVLNVGHDRHIVHGRSGHGVRES